LRIPGPGFTVDHLADFIFRRHHHVDPWSVVILRERCFLGVRTGFHDGFR
jgi:hypothetical protein